MDPEEEIRALELEGPVAVIGDIHGRADLLGKLFKKLGKSMPVVFVGDLIDRGPSAFDVVELLMARGAQGVRGNHEEWFRRWCEGRGFQGDALHRAFGAKATLASYGIEVDGKLGERFVEIPPAHRRFFREMPLVLDLTVSGTAYWVIHAGIHRSTSVEPGLDPEEVVTWLIENEPYDLLWSAGHLEDARKVDRKVIFGHTPHLKPGSTSRAIAIDTGCGTWEKGKLTAVILPEEKFVSVS